MKYVVVWKLTQSYLYQQVVDVEALGMHEISNVSTAEQVQTALRVRDVEPMMPYEPPTDASTPVLAYGTQRAVVSVRPAKEGE